MKTIFKHNKQERIGQGRGSVKVYLENNPNICSEIENSVKETVKKLNLTNLKKLPYSENEIASDSDSDVYNNDEPTTSTPLQNENDFDLDIKIDENDF